MCDLSVQITQMIFNQNFALLKWHLWRQLQSHWNILLSLTRKFLWMVVRCNHIIRNIKMLHIHIRFKELRHVFEYCLYFNCYELSFKNISLAYSWTSAPCPPYPLSSLIIFIFTLYSLFGNGSSVGVVQ